LCDNLEGRFNIPSTDLDNLQYQIEDRIQHNLTFVTIPETWVDIDYNSNDICELQGDGASNYEMGLCFYYGNHLSSTQMVTDMYGDIIQSVHYAPFGEVITEFTPYWHGGRIPDYLFNGKELDEETGMYYYEARYYNPPMFISRDPMFEKYPSVSPYAYTANNPLKFIDPSGMEAELGDYYGINGKWLGSDGKNDNKAYTATSRNSDGTFNNSNELPISNSELLDRSTWVHGESGGSGEVITNRTQNAGDASAVSDARVADYYANAINNAAKTDGDFYKSIKMRMSKDVNGKTVNTSDGYFNGTGIGGNANSKAFANARQQGMESLMGLAGATTSISAVINSVSGGTDPTGGTRAWLGAPSANKYVGDPNIHRTGAIFQFSFSSGNSKYNHTFFKNK
jgi:RHS repeat-associated protein